MRFSIPLIIVLTPVFLAGCSKPSPETATETPAETETAVLTAVNDHCPIMGSPVTDDGGRYDWNGKTVGFCCPECIDAFADMSDEDKATALAEADDPSAADKPDDHSHGDHDHADSESEAS